MAHLFLILAMVVCGGDERVNDDSLDFDSQIVPVFTRFGCNAGACHGSAAGRGGFHLSLFGSRPELDHQAIVQQLQGRRVNYEDPERSLLLLKPTGELKHGGDHRFELESEAGQLIVAWIKQGADRATPRTLIRLDVSPATIVMDGPELPIQLKSVAVFDDQIERDVTAWTVFEAEDKQSLEIDADAAIAIPKNRGRHIVIARFLDQVTSIEIIVPNGVAEALNAKPEFNFVDAAVNSKLDALRIPISEQADDRAFVRRIYLDLTGALPSPRQVQEFVINTSLDKREELIDRLLTTDEFADYWTYRFGQWLRVGAEAQDGDSATAYYQWIRNQVKQGRPLNQMVQTLITSTGDSRRVGPANFYRTTGSARLQAEFFSQSLMGVQLRCANCHDHPYDRWSQDDYHGLSAVFAKIETGRVVSGNGRGEVINPRTGEPAREKIPGIANTDSSTPGVEQLAQWLVRPSNPFFAKAATNRIWANFFGRGLVNPVDDIRSTNPATHPQLLDQLALDFQEHGYDFRRTIRLICNSAAYQRSSTVVVGNEFDDRYYSRMPTRSLSPEVLADAISNVTLVPEKYGLHDEGTTAIQLHRPGVVAPMLEILGRCADPKTCEIGVTNAGGISRQLQLINGDLLNRRISHQRGRLQQLFQSGMEAPAIVEALYIRCLARMPRDSEMKFWSTQLSTAVENSSSIDVLEDLFWSLLTCREFVTNH